MTHFVRCETVYTYKCRAAWGLLFVFELGIKMLARGCGVICGYAVFQRICEVGPAS